MTDKTVEERLDAHARAIRELRAEVKRLKADQPAASETRMSKSVSGNRSGAKRTPPSDTPGVFKPVTYCLGCGKDKELGKRTIMCGACNKARQTALREGDEIIRYTSCGNCGKKVNGTSTPLCGKCQVSYRKWRDNQKG